MRETTFPEQIQIKAPEGTVLGPKAPRRYPSLPRRLMAALRPCRVALLWPSRGLCRSLISASGSYRSVRGTTMTRTLKRTLTQKQTGLSQNGIR